MQEKKNPLIKFLTSEFVVYIFFGVLTTAVSWVSYALLEIILPNMGQLTFTQNPIEIKIIVSNVLSWIIAFIFAFIVNKLFVFKSKSWEAKIAIKELWQFFVARFLTGFIEWFGMPLLVGIGLNQAMTIPIINKTVEGLWAKIITSFIVVILNYIFSKFIVFKNKDKEKK